METARTPIRTRVCRPTGQLKRDRPYAGTRRLLTEHDESSGMLREFVEEDALRADLLDALDLAAPLHEHALPLRHAHIVRARLRDRRRARCGRDGRHVEVDDQRPPRAAGGAVHADEPVDVLRGGDDRDQAGRLAGERGESSLELGLAEARAGAADPRALEKESVTPRGGFATAARTGPPCGRARVGRRCTAVGGKPSPWSSAARSGWSCVQTPLASRWATSRARACSRCRSSRRVAKASIWTIAFRLMSAKISVSSLMVPGTLDGRENRRRRILAELRVERTERRMIVDDDPVGAERDHRSAAHRVVRDDGGHLGRPRRHVVREPRRHDDAEGRGRYRRSARREFPRALALDRRPPPAPGLRPTRSRR